MTYRLSIELDLNYNDLDALECLLEQPEKLAESVAAKDPHLRSRMIHVLMELATAVRSRAEVRE